MIKLLYYFFVASAVLAAGLLLFAKVAKADVLLQISFAAVSICLVVYLYSLVEK